MASANAQIGVAKAAYYPSINLFGTAGWQASDIAKLANASSIFWAIGANVAEDIFTGGARRAQVEFAQAGFDANVASYRNTVLNAFREVQDGLTGLTVLTQAQEAQQLSVDAARRTLDISTNRYSGGLVSYLDVVTAQQNLLNNEQQLVVDPGAAAADQRFAGESARRRMGRLEPCGSSGEAEVEGHRHAIKKNVILQNKKPRAFARGFFCSRQF